MAFRPMAARYHWPPPAILASSAHRSPEIRLWGMGQGRRARPRQGAGERNAKGSQFRRGPVESRPCKRIPASAKPCSERKAKRTQSHRRLLASAAHAPKDLRLHRSRNTRQPSRITKAVARASPPAASASGPMSPPWRWLRPAVAATISGAAPGLTRSTLQAKKRNEPNSAQTTWNQGIAGESPLPPHRPAGENTKRTQSRPPLRLNRSTPHSATKNAATNPISPKLLGIRALQGNPYSSLRSTGEITKRTQFIPSPLESRSSRGIPAPASRSMHEYTKRTQSRQGLWHHRPRGQARVLVITGGQACLPAAGTACRAPASRPMGLLRQGIMRIRRVSGVGDGSR